MEHRYDTLEGKAERWDWVVENTPRCLNGKTHEQNVVDWVRGWWEIKFGLRRLPHIDSNTDGVVTTSTHSLSRTLNSLATHNTYKNE